MKCLKCGNEYEGNFCPKCGTAENNKSATQPQQSKPKKKKGCLTALLVIVIFMFAFAIVMGILFGEEQTDNQSSSVSSVALEENSSEEKNNSYETKKDLITFNDVSAEFVKLYDPKAGVTALAVALNLENNGTKEVTVSLSDGYVNDTKVQFMSGLPVTIAQGKKAVGAFMFGYDGLGFSKVEDIKKMEFKLTLLDESYNLESSKTITIDFK